MNKTLAECHMDIVNELRSRGEPIFNPCIATMDGKRIRPKVYVKDRQFGTIEFLCGSAIREKDGTISIMPEPMRVLRGFGGFKIEELGLCDPICYYANMDGKTYPRKPVLGIKPLMFINARSQAKDYPGLNPISDLQEEVKELRESLEISHENRIDNLKYIMEYIKKLEFKVEELVFMATGSEEEAKNAVRVLRLE